MDTPKHTLAALIITLAATQAHAVVEAGHWSSAVRGTEFKVAVDQTIGGDYTGVLMTFDKGMLKGVTFNVDEGADIFVVRPGDAFGNAFVQSGQGAFIMGVSATAGLPTRQVNVGQDFYLAARTRIGTFDATTFNVFGWAHFKVDGQGLPQLVDSAMAFGEGGIVVGTLQAVPVPEPGTSALMGLGLAGLCWRLRRRQR